MTSVTVGRFLFRVSPGYTQYYISNRGALARKTRQDRVSTAECSFLYICGVLGSRQSSDDLFLLTCLGPTTWAIRTPVTPAKTALSFIPSCYRRSPTGSDVRLSRIPPHCPPGYRWMLSNVLRTSSAGVAYQVRSHTSLRAVTGNTTPTQYRRL